MKVVFRVDVGPGIGLGHLSRCTALADALGELGADSIFLTPPAEGVRERIPATAALAELPGPRGSAADLDATRQLARQETADVLVVDSYAVDADYLATLSDSGAYVVAIDDLARFPFPCPLVVNGGAAAARSRYVAANGRDVSFLLGAQYALLRREFWQVPPRPPAAEASRILVTVGGTDPRGLLHALLERLVHLPGSLDVVAVAGPFSSGDGRTASVGQHRLRVVHAPLSLRDEMLACDLAVSAAGQTLYELAATGTPAIAFQLVENQADNLRSLAASGCARVVESGAPAATAATAVAAAAELLRDREGRARMAAAGRRFVDGRGAIRVAEAVAAAVS